MAETKTEEIPIQGKLINQKLTKNELEVEMIINGIRKCDMGEKELTELRTKARKALQSISLDIEVNHRNIVSFHKMFCIMKTIHFLQYSNQCAQLNSEVALHSYH